MKIIMIEYIQTTRAFPVIPKKKINAYKEISTTKKGRRVSSGMSCSAAVLVASEEILVVFIGLRGYSLLPLSKAIIE